MKSWISLLVLGFVSVSCARDHVEDLIMLRDDLLMPLIDIAGYITGSRKEFDHIGNIVGEKPCEKDFAKAHALFQDEAKRLRGYPDITNHAIAQSTLGEIHTILNQLKQHIDNLPGGPEQNQFNKEWHHLFQYVSSLMAKKDASQRSITRPRG